MLDDELLLAAKIRLRKMNTDILDEDIHQIGSVAIADLQRIGVAPRYLIGQIEDPIIREAILIFINANYGNNPDREKLMTAYEMMLTRIKGGKYFD